MAKVIDRARPLSMYSATILYRTVQTKVAEGLLLGEWPSSCCKWPHETAQGPACNLVFARGAGANCHLPPLLYIWLTQWARGRSREHSSPIPVWVSSVLSTVWWSLLPNSDILDCLVLTWCLPKEVDIWFQQAFTRLMMLIWVFAIIFCWECIFLVLALIA